MSGSSSPPGTAPAPLLPLEGPPPWLVGMVHLLPLPGAPGWRGSMDEVLDRACADATALAGAGFDAVMVENFGDVPFHPGRVPPETVAAMARAVAAVRGAASLPVGVNVLRNDAEAALALAAVCDAAFIRVNVHVGAMWTDQGLIQGRAHATLRRRAHLAPGVAIFADVHVKHATPPSGWGLEDAARDTWWRGLADALVVSGSGTGAATAPADLHRVRQAVPKAVIFVGSGVTAAHAHQLLAEADGAIVGTSVMNDGRPGTGIDPARAAALVAAVRG